MGVQTPSRSYQIQSIVKATNVINYLLNSKAPVTLSAMATHLGMAKSTLYGIVSTLENACIIRQVSENGPYTLGWKLYEIGNLVSDQFISQKKYTPFLQSLAEEAKETIFLGIFDRGEVVYINKIESVFSRKTEIEIGSRLPAHCLSAGKILLSSLTKDELKYTVKKKGLSPFTKKTITNDEELFLEIEKVKEVGYAINDQEYMIGLRGMAVPIWNDLGQIIAAMGMTTFNSKASMMKLDKMKNLLMTTSQAISQQLG